MPGVVNILDDVITTLFRLWTAFDTSGKSGPVGSANWCSNESARISAFSDAEKASPFGPCKGCEAGRLIKRFLLSL